MRIFIKMQEDYLRGSYLIVFLRKIKEIFKKHQYLTWDVDPYDLV